MGPAQITALLVFAAAVPLCTWLLLAVYRSGTSAPPAAVTPGPQLEPLLTLARSRLTGVHDPGIQVFAQTRLQTYQTLPDDHAALLVRELLVDLERFAPADARSPPARTNASQLCDLADQAVRAPARWRNAMVAVGLLGQFERRLTSLVGPRRAQTTLARAGHRPTALAEVAQWIDDGSMLAWCEGLVETSTVELGSARLTTLLEQGARDVGRHVPLASLPQVLDALPADILVAERTYASTRDALWEGMVAAQQQVQRARDVAAQSERWATLGRLAAGVGHEINNPLSFVIQTAAMLREDLASRSGDEQLAELAENAEQMTHGLIRIRRIVRDLGAFARGGQSACETIDVHALVDSMLTVAQSEVRAKALLIRAFEPVPMIRGDSGRLGQVIVNLLVNAAQALPSGRSANRITVRVRAGDNRTVAVEVQDNGPGVPAPLRARVFEPFFTTKDGSGTGLGLAISKEIVETHGGRLEIVTPPEGGARFVMQLPPFVPPPQPL